MTIGKIAGRLFKFLGLLLSILVVTLLGLMYFGVTLDLSFLKQGVEASAGAALEREVKIEGPVVFEFSTWPAIEVQDVQVANVASSSEPLFFSAGRARLQIGILPLLKGSIEIAEISAEDVALNLESNSDGQPNWVFGPEEGKSTEPELPEDASPTPTAEESEPFISFGGVNDLSLKNIDVKYHDASLGKSIQFKLEKMAGSAAPGEPIMLDFNGNINKQLYDLKFNGASIEELLSRGAQTWQFNLEGNVASKQIAAAGDFVVHNNEPQANLEFMIDDIDVGAILSSLGLVEGLRASTGSMGIELTLKGDSLNEIVRQSSMSFSVREGQWRITSPTSDAYFDVEDLTGDILVEKGNAITMKLAGMVDTLPVKFIITGAPLVDYVVAQESIPLNIETEFADSVLSFGGELTLPITSRDLSLFLKFKTENLANLNDLLRLDLPSIGPIEFATKFQLLDNKYQMPELDLQVGESSLAGNMSLDPSKETVEVNIELISELIRIDDFAGIMKALPGTSKDDTAESETTVPQDEEISETSKQPPAKERQNLLSKEVLSSFNADLLVKAKEVTSGEDRLGSATLKVSVQDSLLTVDPLKVDVPGGGVYVGFDYLPGDDGVKVNLNAKIDEFDIGVMVRRRKPESDMGGMFFLDAALSSQAPDLSTMMEYAKGNFNFGLVPKNFSAGIIDMWAVNLVSSIMTKVSEEEQSEINCVVVRFDMEDGMMEEKAIYMDTSNMRVAGKADIDFKNRTFEVIMDPKAKRPEFFSLAVPIKIDGTFEDFGFGIGLARLTGAVFSFITSPVHVPIRRVFADEIPEDGKEACMKAWTITE
jgi:uncharacterized protein involved in outer membrane biogenesis